MTTARPGSGAQPTPTLSNRSEIGTPQSPRHASGLAMVGAVITMVANFGLALILTRAGTGQAGLFFATTAVASIIGNIAGLGSMTGLLYFMPRAMVASTDGPRRLLALAARPVLFTSVGAAGFLALVAPLLADLVVDPNQVDEAATVFRILALAVPFWALTVPLLGATRGIGSMTTTVVSNQVVRPLGQIVGVAALALTSRLTPTAVACAWALPVIAAWVAAVIGGHRQGVFDSNRWGPQPDQTPSTKSIGSSTVTSQEFWRYTRPRTLGVAFAIALERLDVVLVSALAGSATAGVYGAITRYITAGNFAVMSIGQATAPTIRRSIGSKKFTESQQLLGRTAGWMMVITWPYLIILAFKSTTFATLLDPELATGATALTILAVALLINSASGPIDLTLLMLGRSRLSMTIVAAALFVDLALLALLVPRLGINGAAIAWGAAVATMNLGAMLSVYRIRRLHPVQTPGLVAAAGTLAATVPIAILTPDSIVGTAITIAVATPLWLAWMINNRSRLGIVS